MTETADGNILPEPEVDGDHDIAHVHARTIKVLQAGVIPGGLAMTSAFSGAALLGNEMTGSETKGALAAVCLSVGGTLAGIPLARIMASKGRRVGLRTGYTTGLVGATLAMISALTGRYSLLVVGIGLVGAGQAANLAARYTGADLATDANRARSISLVMWASTVGSVLGPVIGLGTKSLFSDAEGTTGFAIPYAISIALFLVALSIIDRQLRPDPLHLAATQGQGTSFRPPQMADVLRIARHPVARVALVGMMLGQAVMVGVMTVTPLHMRDGDQSDIVIAVMMSLHIVGMFAFSPLVGRIVDRIGGELMIALGAVTLFVGSEIASHTGAPDSTGHIVGLFLVGIGWSFAAVAGSTLLTASFALRERVGVQATADVLMTACGAAAGISSGLVVEQRSFETLAHWAGLVAIGLAVVASLGVARRVRVGPESVPVG